MKKLHLLFLMVLLAAFPGFAQTTTSTNTTATTGNGAGVEQNSRPYRGEMLEKLRAMTPEQRQQFLQNHPRLQQFITNHPNLAQKLAGGAEAGPGIKDPGHPRVNEVNQREQNQQERIAQGVKSGSLTPQEAAKLENGEKQIQQKEATDLQNNNGHLTPAEDRQLNREENRESRRIYHKKHND